MTGDPRVAAPVGVHGHRRSGVALVSALALLTLATALLAAACASARSLEHGSRSLRATAQADALARRAFAELVVGWDAAADAIAVGGSIDRALVSDDAGVPTTVRARVTRIGGGLYAVVVDARVGAGSSPLAHRRYRLLLQRSAADDSAHTEATPQPIARWSLEDLY